MWMAPIWTTTMEEMRERRLPEEERSKLIADLRGTLERSTGRAE